MDSLLTWLNANLNIFSVISSANSLIVLMKKCWRAWVIITWDRSSTYEIASGESDTGEKAEDKRWRENRVKNVVREIVDFIRPKWPKHPAYNGITYTSLPLLNKPPFIPFRHLFFLANSHWIPLPQLRHYAKCLSVIYFEYVSLILHGYKGSFVTLIWLNLVDCTKEWKTKQKAIIVKVSNLWKTEGFIHIWTCALCVNQTAGSGLGKRLISLFILNISHLRERLKITLIWREPVGVRTLWIRFTTSD